jgi:hypothetical protein
VMHIKMCSRRGEYWSGGRGSETNGLYGSYWEGHRTFLWGDFPARLSGKGVVK